MPKPTKDVGCFYNGKYVSMDYITDPKARFAMACMRVVDNAKDGFVAEGEKVYYVSRASRGAKLISGGK